MVDFLYLRAISSDRFVSWLVDVLYSKHYEMLEYKHKIEEHEDGSFELYLATRDFMTVIEYKVGKQYINGEEFSFYSVSKDSMIWGIEKTEELKDPDVPFKSEDDK